MPMIKSWDGKNIYAEKAEKDKNGESLELTITEGQVTAIGGKPVAGSGPSGSSVSISYDSVEEEIHFDFSGGNGQGG